LIRATFMTLSDIERRDARGPFSHRFSALCVWLTAMKFGTLTYVERVCYQRVNHVPILSERRPAPANFGPSTTTLADTVWLRAIRFVTVTHLGKWRVSLGPATLLNPTSGTRVPKFLENQTYDHTFWHRATKFSTYSSKRHVLRSNMSPPLKGWCITPPKFFEIPTHATVVSHGNRPTYCNVTTLGER